MDSAILHENHWLALERIWIKLYTSLHFAIPADIHSPLPVNEIKAKEDENM